ncbi:Do family serine endopeptidase [Mariluticola halotolerans]|uniref:Do family serine endopeptidase n=1 Tax=Mariluticola halotolerans TaxID=2909283 RepID=UPI0026E3B40E|nr:Do family serine endopeptidase [Mariluticola halotolerans]UJQ95708.1 Do family serine endopeptidase [Mariluticola halotolerans]
MSSKLLSNSRRWAGASALAMIIALGGGAGVALTTHQAAAQVAVQPGAPSSFADLVEAVKPAVVSITVDGTEQEVSRFNGGPNFSFPDLPDDHPFRRFFEQFGDEFGPQDNGKRKPRHFEAAGSGFIISADGYVVTNNHVVENAENVTVILDDGDELKAEIVGTDPRTDLALLKIQDASDLPHVSFADDEARIGDWVVAVGNPFGLGGTVTAGIISARGRDISGSTYGDFLQIDAAVNRGNSGGPAFNLSGEVVGVNTAIFSPNGGNVGIAFAIPAGTVKQIVDDLKDDGSVTRGFLGVSIQDVSKDIADSVGLPTARGALVTQPADDAPASRAGIRSGDVIVEVDGDTIDNALDLSRTIASKAPGDTVEVVVWREGKRQSFDVVLDTLEEAEVASAEPEQQLPEEEETVITSSVGIVLVPNADGEGLLIKGVESDSIAAGKGFNVGDTILEADNMILSSTEDFEKAIAQVRDSGRSTILIKASRNGNIRFIGLPLEEK